MSLLRLSAAPDEHGESARARLHHQALRIEAVERALEVIQRDIDEERRDLP